MHIMKRVPIKLQEYLETLKSNKTDCQRLCSKVGKATSSKLAS